MTASLAGLEVLQVPTSIDYTSKDWSALVASMKAYAAQSFPQWNTDSEGDFGVMMLELFAYAGDILSYYGDRVVGEAYLPTATQRLSILNIAQTLGYVPSNGAPSSGTVTFQTDTDSPAVSIPQATQLSASGSSDASGAPVVFETVSLALVPGNGGTVTVQVVQGQTFMLVEIGTSDGTIGQQFTIPEIGVLDGTVQVYVQTDDGNEVWEYVPFLVDELPDDKVYTLATDENGVTSVVFGDNLNGLVPGIGLTIWASYRVASGASGNVGAGAVDTILSNLEGVSIALLEDGVTPNSSAMTGGADAESIEQIRTNAPAAFRTQYRAISLGDYADLALNVPGVLMASSDAQHSTSVTLYIMGSNYSPAGPDLIEAILTYFDGKTAAGVTVSIVDPSVIPIDVGSSSNNIQLAIRDGHSQSVVQQKVTAALQSFLSPPNISFGQKITASELYDTVMAIPGVAYVVIPVFTRTDSVQTGTAPIQLRPGEVPSAGQIYIQSTGGV